MSGVLRCTVCHAKLGVLLFVLVLFAVACAAPQDKRAEVSPTPAVIAEDARVQLLLRRVDYALRGVDRLAQRWPWWSSEGSCIVITSLDAQYLLGCAPPEGSPYRESSARFRGAPVYINDSGTAVLGPQSAPYQAFASALVGTAIIYHPAQPALTGFAKAKPWFFVTDLEALVQAHPGFDAEAQTEEWLSIFVHEYFHTQQFLQSTAYDVWGKILTNTLDPTLMVALYQGQDSYKDAVDKEVALLRGAVEQGLSVELAKETLRAWLAMRDERIKRFAGDYKGASLDADELAYLYIEGAARYVESVYLVDASLHPKDGLADDPRFSSFKASEGKGFEGMTQKGIPQGKYFYALGMYVGLLLDAIDPEWTKTVHQHPRWLVGVAQDKIVKP